MPIQVLNNRGATVNPVATVEVLHAINVLDHGPMYVATNSAVNALGSGVADNGIFKVKDEADRCFYFSFCIAGQRPVAGSFEGSAKPRQIVIDADKKVIGFVTQHSNPPVVASDLIEFIAVQKKITPAIRCRVDVLVLH